MALAKKPRKAATKTTPRPLRILLTGFGPFPGAPFNPTGDLIAGLARRLRPAFADVSISTHVFPTTYAAVDHDLPRLLARKKPDALLMFGLATRSRGLRVELRARNLISASADAAGVTPGPCAIVAGGPRALPIRAPRAALLRAATRSGMPARLSADAGKYLCNYLYWRVLEATDRTGGPARAAFIHVPLVEIDAGKTAGRKPKNKRRTVDDLIDRAETIARAMIRATRR